MHKQYAADKLIADTEENWPSSDPFAGSFAIYLHRTVQLSERQYMPIVEKYKITSTEFDVLAALRCSPAPHTMTPTEAQRSMLLASITSGGLTKLLYQLEEKGLITRSVQEQDKRSKLIHLTDRGKDIIENSMQELHVLERSTLENALEGKELEQLIHLLGKVARSLESASGDFADE